MSSGSFENSIYEMFTNHTYLIYMYLALDNLQWLICFTTQPNQTNLLMHFLRIFSIRSHIQEYVWKRAANLRAQGGLIIVMSCC